MHDDKLSKFRLYTGEDCLKWFVNELKQMANELNIIFDNPLPMIPLTPDENIHFQNAKTCFVCGELFNAEANDKVKDHSHLDGRFRGACHRSCNLNFSESHEIPIVSHNMSNYDGHLLIKHLATEMEGNISILPINKEKYISFTKYVKNTRLRFRFLDSFRFMAKSLDSLSSYLNDDQKIITKKFCETEMQFKLLNRKGVFPYEYVNSWEKLKETVLPPQECFFSKIKDEHISDEDYIHAQKVWDLFKIQNLQQYAELYLKTDVTLLADVFENFRSFCLRTYGLDSLHYYTAPGLSFDAMLKYTKVNLELLQDIDMFNFIERGIRGGVSQCSNRYGKSNNKYMNEHFNPEIPISYLMYYDVNNLYGAAMMKSLPYANFHWVEPMDVYGENIFDCREDDEYGYILEVDLSYPKELFEEHKDLPFCPQHMIPPVSDSNERKLLTTLYPKKNYVIHYAYLQQALKFGLKLEKIHKCLKFQQKQWIKPYIDLNTELRKQSKNDFEIELFKLMINVIYGKAIENVRKYREIKLVTKWEGRYGANYYISKPNFHSCSIIAKDFILIEMKRLKITLNKPIYAGMAILDLSKIYLYDFHYSYIKQKYAEKAKLLYTDTDSLIYHFYVNDIYQDIKKDIKYFDTSSYPVNNRYNIPLANKKVIGLMKDENQGLIMTEFIGLRSKMYSLKVLMDESTENYKIIKKAKGIQKAAIKKIQFQDYYNTLFNHSNLSTNQNTIISENHELFTVNQEKLALSFKDDKRIVSWFNTDTFPWGFFD